MAEQDDLSQLMPVLYSKVKLTTASDETAGLAMYTAARNALAAPHVLVAPAVALVQSETSNHMPSQVLEAVRRPPGLIEAKLSKGTGRPVGRRGFDLCFRLSQHFASDKPSAAGRSHHNSLGLQHATADMEVCNSQQPNTAGDVLPKSAAIKEQDRLDQQLKALCDISNSRHGQLKLRTGSGRAVTRRYYDVALPAMPHAAEQPSRTEHTSAALSPAQPCSALSPPCQLPSLADNSPAMPQHSSKSRKSSLGSAMEGVLERPWRSIGKQLQSSRFVTPGTALRATPMEGIPERFDWPGTVRRSSVQRSQTDSTPVGLSKRQAVLRLQLSPGDEAQLLHDQSPVQGLLEPQSYPAPQHSSGNAHRQGSLGFFGSLNTAPLLFDTPGAVMQNAESDSDDVEMDYGFADVDNSSDADEAVGAAAASPTSMQACSPAEQEDQHRTPAHHMTPAQAVDAAQHTLPADHATPAQNAASPQPMSSVQHDASTQAMQSAQQTTPTEQQSAEHAMSPGVSAPGMASAVQPSGVRAAPDSHHSRRITPHFREMQVQTGSSLPGTPASPSQAEAANDGTQDAASHDDLMPAALAQAQDETQQDVMQSVKPQKAVRKSEAHQRLKESNRQRRSLAGEGLHGDHGVRRSSRSKHAPLEYWRNERKVYNREFRSLPTVHHYATRTPSPSWKFVQDLPHRKRSRLATSQAVAE